MGGEACRMQSVLLLSLGLSLVGADNNFLTGANDVIAVEGEEGELRASPFAAQFGKKDIWLPRSGNTQNHDAGVMCFMRHCVM